MVINGSRIVEKVMHITWILWLFFVIAFSDSITVYANLCAIIMMMIAAIYILQTHSLYIPKQLYSIILFGVFATVSVVWSLDSDTTTIRAITTWRMIALLVLMANYVRFSGDGKFLYTGIEIAGNITALYTIRYYGIAGLRQLGATTGFRIGVGFVNENALGIFLVVSAIITMYQAIHRREYKRILLMVLPLLVSLLTASRKVLIILIVSIAFILWRELSQSDEARTKIRIVLIIAVALVIVGYVYQSPIAAVLRVRIESMLGKTSSVDQSMLNRVSMVSIGFDQFKKTPILGCGIGASSVLTNGTYLHNNYIELLATSGIIGFILYYGYYFSCFICLIRIKNASETIDISLLLLLICMITDFASVSYFSKTQYMLFIVIISGVIYSNALKNDIGD